MAEIDDEIDFHYENRKNDFHRTTSTASALSMTCPPSPEDRNCQLTALVGAVVVGEVRVRVRREDRVHRGAVPPQARDAQRRVA